MSDVWKIVAWSIGRTIDQVSVWIRVWVHLFGERHDGKVRREIRSNIFSPTKLFPLSASSLSES